MFRASFFLAFRYLKPRLSFKTIPLIFSVIGPMLGIAVLIVVMSVMKGFQEEIRNKILNIQAHLQIKAFDGPIKEPDKLVAELEKLGFKATPVVEGHIVLQNNRTIVPAFLIGIDQRTDRHVTNISESCKSLEDVLNRTTEGDPLEKYNALDGNQVIMGRKL
ncbi:MAG: hypothetical protein HRT89_14845, partial [Lentisphaeria bacterium]|nr:hypothetical protein [Lentisphaeria bacterium]NQZ69337.1 hypothetical protein [Lentisphaeria bacterium]